MAETKEGDDAGTTDERSGTALSLGAPLGRRRDLLVRAGLESVLIVLSVFLALFLDEWRADRQVEERLATARTYLIREVRANRDALRADPVLPYHLRTRELLGDALGPPGPKQTAAMERLEAGAFEGVHPFRAQDVVWTSFRTTELASRLPPDELFLLAEIYDAQEDLEKLSEVFLGGFLQPSSEFESEAYEKSQLSLVLLYFGDAIPAEQSLIPAYDRALAKLQGSKAR